MEKRTNEKIGGENKTRIRRPPPLRPPWTMGYAYGYSVDGYKGYSTGYAYGVPGPERSDGAWLVRVPGGYTTRQAIVKRVRARPL